MALEYAMLEEFLRKSDVYSFGVLILEVVSGQKNQFQQWGEDERPYKLCKYKYLYVKLVIS